jgi:hypothetical protein
MLSESTVLIVAGASLGVSVAAFIFAVCRHATYATYPPAMAFYLRVLLVPSLFATIAVFEALFDATVEHALEIPRACIEAVAIYYFLCLFEAVAGGDVAAVNELEKEAPTVCRCWTACSSLTGLQRYRLIHVLVAQVDSPCSQLASSRPTRFGMRTKRHARY